ncbi:hypothetical protein C8J55DRAFT_493259 [Lentinula edodes]|uniref:Uncharacterized protein n=1 Tax=Lentinula lateritia TaxID=40482 RepID=A0A9W9DE06_9AGAR|nr:hypothetical protein C8J55DRAFT_493259 [Lentinula edodes]
MHLRHFISFTIPLTILLFRAVHLIPSAHAVPIDSEAIVSREPNWNTRDNGGNVVPVPEVVGSTINVDLHARFIHNPPLHRLRQDIIKIFCTNTKPSTTPPPPPNSLITLQEDITKFVTAAKSAMGLKGLGDPKVEFTNAEKCVFVSMEAPVEYTVQVEGHTNCAERETSFCRGTMYQRAGKETIKAENNTLLYPPPLAK